MEQILSCANDEVTGNKRCVRASWIAAPTVCNLALRSENYRCYPQGFSKSAIFLVAENRGCPHLVKGGIPIKKVNIGNMHTMGKRQVATSVAVDDKDVAAFVNFRMGVTLEIRRVPRPRSRISQSYSSKFCAQLPGRDYKVAMVQRFSRLAKVFG